MPEYRDPIQGGITTLIQGPINEVSLNNIHNYLRNGPVLIHAWELDVQTIWNMDRRQADIHKMRLLEVEKRFGDRVRVIIKPVPKEAQNIEAIHAQRWGDWGEQLARQTFHLAMYGISDALQYVNTDHVLRVRSDEAYSDVDLFIEALSRDPKRFVMGNMFVAAMKDSEFHIGDHIYACKSEGLYHATKQLASFYYGYNKDPKWFYFLRPIGFEQVLAYSWMDCNGIDMSLPLRPENIMDIPLMQKRPTLLPSETGEATISVEHTKVQDFILANSVESKFEHREMKKQIVHDYFHVIDINKTGHFTAQWNHGGRTFKNEFVNPHGVYNTGDMLDGY